MKETIFTNLKTQLNKNRIKLTYLKDAKALREYLRTEIPSGASVGVGDSVTLEDTGVYNLLREMPVEFYDKYDTSLSSDEKREQYLSNFSADYFISGINALTESGKIVNLDGNGSRVAPIIYGPKRVMLIAGTNKIVTDESAAIHRIRTIAAPLDAKRLKKRTPCSQTGVCMDCKSPEKICNYYTIVQGQFNEARIEVVLIEGNYGY